MDEFHSFTDNHSRISSFSKKMSFQYEDFDEKDFEDVPLLLEQVTDIKTCDDFNHNLNNIRNKIKNQYLTGEAFQKYSIPNDNSNHRL